MIRPASASPTPHSNAQSGALPSVLARVYARALQRYQESQKAAEYTPEPDGRDGTAVQGDSANESIIPK